MLVTEVRPAHARVALQAIKSAIPEKVHKVAMNLICQLVAPMGTTFWLINFFQPMLHVEVMVLRARNALQDIIHLSPATKMICFFKPVISYETTSQKTFKTGFKHLATLVLELLTLLYP